MLPKVKKNIINNNNLQAQHSQKLAFHAFNVCTLWERIRKVKDSQKHMCLDKKCTQTNTFQFHSLKGTLHSLRLTHFFGSLIVYIKPYTERLQCFSHPCNYLSFDHLGWDHQTLIESLSGLVRWNYTNCSSCQSSFDSN